MSDSPLDRAHATLARHGHATGDGTRGLQAAVRAEIKAATYLVASHAARDADATVKQTSLTARNAARAPGPKTPRGPGDVKSRRTKLE